MRAGQVATVTDRAVVGLLAVSSQATVWFSDGTGWQGGRAVHAVLLAVTTVPLLLRRRWPLPIVLLVTGAAWVQYELGGGTFQPWFAWLLSLYAVAAHAPMRLAIAGAAATAAAVLAIDIPKLVEGDPVDEVVPAWAVLAGTWAFGRWMRSRRRETSELASRAEAAEREVEEQAERAVVEERARIARELHDLVAHSMGVIVIQSQAGQRSLGADPVAARSALEAIENVGRQGMAEMRRLLDLLTGTDESSNQPQPSLTQLDELVDHVRAAGLPVDLAVGGELSELPAGVDLAAYRVVQEALTNVLKHARATRVRVSVSLVGASLDIDVHDDGVGVGEASARGRGLVGMRERVALYGGTVAAGAVGGGGYRVHARLPLMKESA